ncbi:MAG: glycine--tRNA ligase subunit beta [Gammaproteobacteria bacterium]|nr:MAG: glycine--tRNA ligase subunit beta [Pseudomonadota bacterium]PIE38295.1 MAG: glycine--tRNA ligase subunit beta [Gammaproteobacteria bacterium]
MATTDFLVEIGTEELPPRALKNLSASFQSGIENGLGNTGIGFTSITSFATPRRLAVLINGLDTRQPDSQVERKGPAASAAYDADGNPTRALQGFARSCNTTPDQLEKIETPKGEWLVYRATRPGQPTRDLLPQIVSDSLSGLPIPKRMRWGASRTEFVRPAHWVIMLLGDEVIDCTILGLKASNMTRGHRFMAPSQVGIATPNDYAALLESQGKVIASFDKRRQQIEKSVANIAQTVNGQAVIDEDLLDEVTGLNEWPVPLIGKFDEKFLEVPAQALISSMKEHQKYFHVVSSDDTDNAMLPYFITISNIESKDPAQVVSGNEKVIRPRLSDAAFFFETDQKSTLESRVEQLKPIVFQASLGTVYDKITRVSRIAGDIAEQIGGERELGKRAGYLCKSDLVTEMVLEFPDLQGIMGYHYACNDGEPEEVALALNEQYLPRFSGDTLPTTKTGCALSIADKMDTIVGIFGINQPPSGTKDPFALRRAALGVLRIIVEKELNLDLRQCIRLAIEQHESLPAENLEETVFEYMLERFRAWYEDAGIDTAVYLAVHARRPAKPLDFDHRIKAVNEFIKLPEADALAAANKRVSNILGKQNANDISQTIHYDLLKEEAEILLGTTLKDLSGEVDPLFEQGDYQSGLTRLAKLKNPIDRFFDEVMVMTEDERIRNNRLALLAELRRLFIRVADISLLQTSN